MSNDPVIPRSLLTAGGLADVVTVTSLGGDGLDNKLTKVSLADGQVVVVRESREPMPSPMSRMQFLRSHGVPTPELFAADDSGTAIWEYAPGQSLAELIADGPVSAAIWHHLGEVFAAVHAVVFPAPLQGDIEADTITLHPRDPVDELHQGVEEAATWVDRHLPQLSDSLRQLHDLIRERQHELRAQQPTVTHGDVNLQNIIVDDHQVALIDWDYPRVRYPLAELAALDEHVYLNGLAGLPPSFFDGYRRRVDRNLMSIYRMVGCLGWLSSTCWTEWDQDPQLATHLKARFHHWHARLLQWAASIPNLIEQKLIEG